MLALMKLLSTLRPLQQLLRTEADLQALGILMLIQGILRRREEGAECGMLVTAQEQEDGGILENGQAQ